MKFRFWNKKPKTVINHFNSNYPRKALVSAVQRPFIKPLNFKHNNQIEAVEIAQVVHELGYQVDVVNFSSTLDIDYTKYDLLVGSGASFEHVFMKQAKHRPKTILYIVGAITPVWNRASLRRLQDVFQRREPGCPDRAASSPAGRSALRRWLTASSCWATRKSPTPSGPSPPAPCMSCPCSTSRWRTPRKS